MHLVSEFWEALERGQLPPRFVIDLAKEHFLSLCPTCADEFRSFLERTGKKELPSAVVTAAVLGEQAKRLHLQERAARRDVEDLLSTPYEGRLAKIGRARRRYRGAAVVHGLLDRYWKVFYTDPREAYRIAELAWTVARVSHDSLRLHDLVVLAASHIGNAARAAGDLNHANRWFTHVREMLDREDVRSVDTLAKVDFLEGALRKDQRQLAESARLLARSLTLYRLTGARLEIARVLLNLGDTYYLWGRVKKALSKVEETLVLVDRESEPHLYLCAQHNRAFYLSEQGRHEEAARLLEAHQDLYRSQGDCWMTLHLAWLWGRIHVGLGDDMRAEESFRCSRAGFLEQRLAYPAALVSLDLAALCLKQMRLTEVKDLAEAIIPVFQAQEIHREALAAWLVFREAAQRETVHTDLIRKLARYLELSKSDPQLRFEPGA